MLIPRRAFLIIPECDKIAKVWQSFPGVNHMIRRSLAALALFVISTSIATGAPIQLRSGSIEPQGVKSGEVLPSGYVLIQFAALPDSKHAYETAGIRLLRYLPDRAWWAYVEPAQNQLAGLVATGVVTYIASAAQVDKVEPALRGRDKGATLDVLTLFLAGVSQRDVEAALQGVVSGPVRWQMERLAVLSLPPGNLALLNAVPGVEWISTVPGPDRNHNVISAQRVHADTLRTAPYNLDGTGITFGVWEAEGVPFPHDDIKDHLIFADEGDISDHATHVTGTLIGTGAGAEAAMGFAPGAYVRAFTAEGDIPEMVVSTLAGNVQLSNHSYGTRIGWDWDGGWQDYGTELFGAYSALSYFWDNAVRQTELVVFKSAGNDRNDDPDGSGPIAGDGPYDTIEHRAAAKNIITMGALDDADAVSSFSSWGPADDGRVKPDLCANGVGLFSTIPNNEYAFFSGTSMSSPSGCGAGGLLYQHFRTVNSADPKAATLKALMIHGAQDLGRPGPDYQYGWGIIHASRSAEYISSNLWREGQVTTGNGISYQVQVPEGVESLRATLVWTDVPGSPASALALTNDLDLLLRDPEGGEHLPFVLDKENPESDATTGRNAVDNVEQVVVSTPTAGTWEIVVFGHAVPEGPNPFTVVSEAFGDFLGSEGEGGGVVEGEGTADGEVEGVLEGEGQSGGCASAPIVVDFCADFLRVRNNNLLRQLDAEFQPLVAKLDPAVADINGIYFVDISDLTEPIIEVQGNGILDAGNELALVQKILADPCFDNGRVTHAQLRAAWNANRKQLLEKQIGPLAPSLTALIRGLDNILVGFLCVGGGQVFSSSSNSASGEGSFGIVAGLFQVINDQLIAELGQGFVDPTLDPADFVSIEALRANRNADRDEYTNAQEYAHFPTRICATTKEVTWPDYPTAALDGSIFPGQEVAEGEGAQEGEGTGEGEGAVEGGNEGEGEGVGEGTLEEGEGAGTSSQYHSADTDQSGGLSLAELLRPIQFFNADGFACAAPEGEQEDAYAAGFGDCSGCAAYAGDYEAPACHISLSELLRLIQLFNTGAYHPCDEPDGFCPGASP